MDDKANHYARCERNTKTNLHILDLKKEIKNASPRESLEMLTMLRR
jgi:hypothetical protein